MLLDTNTHGIEKPLRFILANISASLLVLSITVPATIRRSPSVSLPRLYHVLEVLGAILGGSSQEGRLKGHHKLQKVFNLRN